MELDVEISVKNYRCFANSPVRFNLKRGTHSFVGINNSGKSSLLKLFYELRPIFNSLINSQTILLSYNPTPLQLMPMVKDGDELLHDRNTHDAVVSFTIKNSFPVSHIPAPTRLDIVLPRSGGNWYLRIGTQNGMLSSVQNIIPAPNNVIMRHEPAQTPSAVADLTPILDLTSALRRCLYLGPFRNTVNVGGSSDYYDIQIGQPFITKWRTLKTGNVKKPREATFRLTEDIKRIFNFANLEINPSEDGQSLQLTIDGKTYNQSEVGSGLIQFILVLVNAATNKASFILIDEPELNLHPSLQIDFLTTLASYSDYGVLFATHNLGLARAVSDRVYSVRRVGSEREVKDFAGTPNLAEFLGEMGFNAYRDLGYDTVLLVEGPTDVRCIQQLLRIYGKEHQVVLLQLGGSSMINGKRENELSEVTRVSNNVFALIDSERKTADADLSPGRFDFEKSCTQLGIKCHVLERRALENYFPAHAIQEAKSEKYGALGPYELLKNANPAWDKAENWKIARLMNDEDIQGTDLGDFLSRLGPS